MIFCGKKREIIINEIFNVLKQKFVIHLYFQTIKIYSNKDFTQYNSTCFNFIVIAKHLILKVLRLATRVGTKCIHNQWVISAHTHTLIEKKS